MAPLRLVRGTLHGCLVPRRRRSSREASSLSVLVD